MSKPFGNSTSSNLDINPPTRVVRVDPFSGGDTSVRISPSESAAVAQSVTETMDGAESAIGGFFSSLRNSISNGLRRIHVPDRVRLAYYDAQTKVSNGLNKTKKNIYWAATSQDPRARAIVIGMSVLTVGLLGRTLYRKYKQYKNDAAKSRSQQSRRVLPTIVRLPSDLSGLGSCYLLLLSGGLQHCPELGKKSDNDGLECFCFGASTSGKSRKTKNDKESKDSEEEVGRYCARVLDYRGLQTRVSGTCQQCVSKQLERKETKACACVGVCQCCACGVGRALRVRVGDLWEIGFARILEYCRTVCRQVALQSAESSEGLSSYGSEAFLSASNGPSFVEAVLLRFAQSLAGPQEEQDEVVGTTTQRLERIPPSLFVALRMLHVNYAVGEKGLEIRNDLVTRPTPLSDPSLSLVRSLARTYSELSESLTVHAASIWKRIEVRLPNQNQDTTLSATYPVNAVVQQMTQVLEKSFRVQSKTFVHYFRQRVISVPHKR